MWRGCSTRAKPGTALSAAGEVCGVGCLVPSRGKDRRNNNEAGHHARARVVQFLVVAATCASSFRFESRLIDPSVGLEPGF